MQEEAVLKQKLELLMKAKGWKVHKIGGSAFGNRGWPDWYCTHRTLGQRWIEIKTPTGRLSPNQVRMIYEFHKHGVDVWIISSIADWEHVLMQTGNWAYWVKI